MCIQLLILVQFIGALTKPLLLHFSLNFGQICGRFYVCKSGQWPLFSGFCEKIGAKNF